VRGEVFRLRAARRARGHEHAGPRYAVVVQFDSLPLSTSLGGAHSTSARPAGFRPEVRIAGRTTRVLAEQTAAVDPGRLGDGAGRLTVDELRRVDAALLLVLDLRLPEPRAGGPVRGAGASACVYSDRYSDVVTQNAAVTPRRTSREAPSPAVPGRRWLGAPAVLALAAAESTAPRARRRRCAPAAWSIRDLVSQETWTSRIESRPVHGQAHHEPCPDSVRQPGTVRKITSDSCPTGRPLVP
jgi:mRNA interferase MazF